LRDRCTHRCELTRTRRPGQARWSPPRFTSSRHRHRNSGVGCLCGVPGRPVRELPTDLFESVGSCAAASRSLCTAPRAEAADRRALPRTAKRSIGPRGRRHRAGSEPDARCAPPAVTVAIAHPRGRRLRRAMNTQRPMDERDRDRALVKLRWLTAVSGIASLAAAAFATSAAAQASTPVHASAIESAKANAAAGSLTAEQLAALRFALPKPSTVVIWATPRGAMSTGRATPAGPAPAAAPAPRPAPAPPPPPVATTGTS
jgi:hypothetical protein